jgi:hypothetical protein
MRGGQFAQRFVGAMVIRYALHAAGRDPIDERNVIGAKSVLSSSDDAVGIETLIFTAPHDESL